MNETISICEKSAFFSYENEKKCGRVEIISFFEKYQMPDTEQQYTLILKFTPSEYSPSKFINKNHQMKIDMNMDNFYNFILSLKCLYGKANTKVPNLLESKFIGVSNGKEKEFTISLDQNYYQIPLEIKDIFLNETDKEILQVSSFFNE